MPTKVGTRGGVRRWGALIGVAVLAASLGAAGPVGAAVPEALVLSTTVNDCHVDVAISSDYSPDDAYASLRIVDSNGNEAGFSDDLNALGDFSGSLDIGEDAVLTSHTVVITLQLLATADDSVISESPYNYDTSGCDLLPLTVVKQVENLPAGQTLAYGFQIEKGQCGASSFAGSFSVPAEGGSVTLYVYDGYFCLDETASQGAAVGYSPSADIDVPKEGSATVGVTNHFDPVAAESTTTTTTAAPATTTATVVAATVAAPRFTG